MNEFGGITKTKTKKSSLDRPYRKKKVSGSNVRGGRTVEIVGGKTK